MKRFKGLGYKQLSKISTSHRTQFNQTCKEDGTAANPPRLSRYRDNPRDITSTAQTIFHTCGLPVIAPPESQADG